MQRVAGRRKANGNMLAIKFLAAAMILASGLGMELSLRQHAKEVWGLHELNLGQDPLQCSRYLCKPQNITMSPDACIHYQDGTYYLQSCSGRNDSKTFCSTDVSEDGTDNMCQVPPPSNNTTSWPGEKCYNNSSCVSGICDPQTNLCAGAGNGDDCSQNADCGPRLFCTGGSCRQQQLKGEACSSDFDCQNWLGCNKTSLFIGMCVPYFSVPVGGYVTDCMSDATSYLCQTGTCQQYSIRGAGVCIKTIRAVAVQPQVCFTNSDCMGTSGSGVDFQGSCQCGVNPSGSSYCTPFLGDPAGKNFLYFWMQLATGNITSQCNTMRRFNYNCIMSLPVTYKSQAVAANLMYLYYPTLQGNDHCIKTIYTTYYWEFGGAQAMAGVLASLLVAIY